MQLSFSMVVTSFPSIKLIIELIFDSFYFPIKSGRHVFKEKIENCLRASAPALLQLSSTLFPCLLPLLSLRASPLLALRSSPLLRMTESPLQPTLLPSLGGVKPPDVALRLARHHGHQLVLRIVDLSARLQPVHMPRKKNEF